MLAVLCLFHLIKYLSSDDEFAKVIKKIYFFKKGCIFSYMSLRGPMRGLVHLINIHKLHRPRIQITDI